MRNLSAAMGAEGNNAGAVDFGGPQAAPAQFQVGCVGFGPSWQEDELSLREMYDAACRSIVRLECELEEANARIAVLEEEQRIFSRNHAPRLTDEDDIRESCREKEAADRIGGNPWSAW